MRKYFHGYHLKLTNFNLKTSKISSVHKSLLIIQLKLYQQQLIRHPLTLLTVFKFKDQLKSQIYICLYCLIQPYFF